MKMNKNTIGHLAEFITEDPSEFSPDLQVSGGPLDIMEQEERQQLLPGMEDTGGRKVLSNENTIDRLVEFFTEDPSGVSPEKTAMGKMPEPGGYKFRVYKHTASGQYDAFANFKSLKDAVEYMRNWNPNQMTNWYIVDEDSGKRFQWDGQQEKLAVTYSGMGIKVT